MLDLLSFFFFKQKTAYEMRISDWSSDVCSSDLVATKSTRNSTYHAMTRRAWKKKLLITVAVPMVGRTRPRIVTGTTQLPAAATKRGCSRRNPEAHARNQRCGRRASLKVAVHRLPVDRKSVVSGKRWSGRVNPGWRRIN